MSKIFKASANSWTLHIFVVTEFKITVFLTSCGVPILLPSQSDTWKVSIAFSVSKLQTFTLILSTPQGLFNLSINTCVLVIILVKLVSIFVIVFCIFVNNIWVSLFSISIVVKILFNISLLVANKLSKSSVFKFIVSILINLIKKLKKISYKDTFIMNKKGQLSQDGRKLLLTTIEIFR